MMIFDYTTKNCPHFKPKSRFVELPCEVGQAVYALMGGFIDEIKVSRFALVLAPNKQHPIGYIKGFEDFGKTVFLSKEEAENALQERGK